MQGSIFTMDYNEGHSGLQVPGAVASGAILSGAAIYLPTVKVAIVPVGQKPRCVPALVGYWAVF
jgi:hypothetical protein